MTLLEKIKIVSDFFKERMNTTEHTINSNISDLRDYDKYYIPEGYDNCELVIYGDKLMQNCVFIKSKGNFDTFVLAPRKDIGYSKEFLDDIIALYIRL